MGEEIKKSIADYLGDHNKMTLATAAKDGRPLAHTVEYVSEGTIVYFGTSIKTRKAQNIINNPSVAYAVDEDYEDWMKIKGVQMEGLAGILKDPSEIQRVGAMYFKKFPMVAKFAGNPDMILVKIEPVRGFYLDYSKGFTHRDEAAF